MNDIVYSHQEDGDYSECIDSAFDDVVYHQETKEGDIVTIYQGEPKHYCIASFIPNMVEHIGERMYDEAGECAEN